MTAYSAVDTAVNWNAMTPGQQRDSVIGLAEGGLMMLTPLAARGIAGAFRPGVLPGGTRAGGTGSLTDTGLPIPTIAMRGAPLATAKLGAQVRSVVELLGSDNGRGGRIMSSAEVTAALRARGIRVPSESALRDAINSTPGIDYVGEPSIGGIVRTGAGQFAGMRMSLDDPAAPPTRDQVAGLLDRAGWPEATRNGELATAKQDQLTQPVIYREVEATMKAQEAGQIVGMKDWLQYNGKKAPHELAEAAAELSVARQLASENPGMVVRVGRENIAPYKSGREPRFENGREMRGERHKEFDLSVETPDGQVVKVIEVTSVDAPVSAKGDVRDGIRHAVDKVVDRQGSTEPLNGSREALVHMALDVGKKPTGGGGQIREILPDGTMTFFRPDGTTPIPSRATSGNLYEDIAANIPKVQNHHLLDRITLVDQFRKRIVFEREGKIWKWVRPE
jgi:hypothetical protein